MYALVYIFHNDYNKNVDIVEINYISCNSASMLPGCLEFPFKAKPVITSNTFFWIYGHP